MDLELPRTEDGVCPVIVAIISRRQSGKTTLMAALSADLAPPERSIIVSPVPALAYKVPQLPYLELHASQKDLVEKRFRQFMDGRHVFVFADEFDELCAQHGYIAPAVYDYVNYAGNYGTGLCVAARGTADITKNLLQNVDLAFIGATNEPNALRYLSELLHDPAQPEIDYKEVLKVLPKYVFLLWIPGATRKGNGLWWVKDGEIQPFDPETLRQPGPKPEEVPPTPPASEDTDTSAGSSGSIAPDAGSRSRTGADPTSARAAGSRPTGSASGSRNATGASRSTRSASTRS